MNTNERNYQSMGLVASPRFVCSGGLVASPRDCVHWGARCKPQGLCAAEGSLPAQGMLVVPEGVALFLDFVLIINN